MARLRAVNWLGGLLLAFALAGGCSTAPSATPPSLTPSGPAVAPPVARPVDQIPQRIRIPSIGVDAVIEGIGFTAKNDLDVAPLDAHPEHVGWNLYGAPPGVAGQPALLASHIDMRGTQGAFYHLRDVKVGDKIVVTRGDGSQMTFTTVKTLLWPKVKFSTLDLYHPVPDAEIVLVTCGGPLNRAIHSYMDNTIVRAVLDK